MGACSDSNGNVFLVEGNEVAEYAHAGTTPISTLDLGASYSGQSCSVDPTTGSVAVTIGDASAGNVAIFLGGTGRPTFYVSPIGADFCGYDGQGNLFVDAYSGGGIALAELPAGGDKMTRISISKTLGGDPWQTQWDGKDLTVESIHGTGGTIYRLKVSGSTATLVGTAKLTAAHPLRAFWIQGNVILAPYGASSGSRIAIWRYPAGGKATRSIRSKKLGGDPVRLYAVTISASPQ